MSVGAESSAAASSVGGARVLVVEDSPTQALRMRIALEGQGFDVLVATEPREAVELARRESPDVVLSDVRMPGVDGFQLCKFFRADPQLRSAAFVLNTATMNEEEDRVLGAQVGAHGFIEKGMSPDALAGVLRQAMAEVGA